MNKFFKPDFQRCLLFLALMLPVSLFAQETSPPDSIEILHHAHKHPLPLSCAKIRVGRTTDKEVQNLYGSGIPSPSEGHGGARYYSDKLKRCQLRAVIGPDNVIEEVSLTTFGYPFDAASIVKDFPLNSVSSLLSTSAMLEDSVRLGDSPSKIIKKYGKPNSDEIDETTETITYEDTHAQWEEVLSYSAVFTFRHDKLVRITLYNGE